MAVVESAEAGLAAASRGATIVQLRAPNATARDLEREAMVLKARCPVPVIVSSRCDIALAAGLAGVNLPERDIPVADARTLLGDRWISRSVHGTDHDDEVAGAGADCLIFGPVWETQSHPGVKPQGIEALRRAAAASKIPVIAIGGVTRERVPEVLSVCAGYAAISMFR
jgi:thiamine-phosphate diphosphorylase